MMDMVLFWQNGTEHNHPGMQQKGIIIKENCSQVKAYKDEKT